MNVAESKSQKKEEKSNPDSGYIELADYVSKLDSDKPFNKVFFEHPNNALDFLNIARLLFDEREFENCANLLQPFCVPSPEGTAFFQTNTA